LFLANLLA